MARVHEMFDRATRAVSGRTSTSRRVARRRGMSRRGVSGVAIGAAALLAGAGIVAAVPDARAAIHPPEAEAILLLDGTQTAPADGFNLQIDDNGFNTPGGNISTAHMFCVQANVHFRCGIGDNDLIRVPGTLADASLSQAEGNQLAWILNHRSGYDAEETQAAIWCITNPGSKPAAGNSAQFCADAKAHAVPVAATLSLSAMGAASVPQGTQAHYSLSTNAPTVDLSVSDGGTLPVLCGSAPDNASATIQGARLVQASPAVSRTFELCLTRSAAGNTTLTAALDATSSNLQTWVHPTAPSQCQGLIDADLTTTRQQASATTAWTVDGSITVNKTTFGDVPEGSTFTVELQRDGVAVASHDFPDGDASPWSHTFSGLATGDYTIVETATGGATHVVVNPGGPVTVTGQSAATVSVENQFVGRLALTKHTDVEVDRTFPFQVDCTYRESAVGNWENPVELAPDETFTTPELPAGTTCAIEELDTGNAISTLINRDDVLAQSDKVGTQAGGIIIRNGETTNVTFTNSFSQGSTLPSTTIGGSSTTGATTTSEGSIATQGSTTPSSISEEGDLANTGSDSSRITFVALMLLAAGGALLVGTYRRRAHQVD